MFMVYGIVHNIQIAQTSVRKTRSGFGLLGREVVVMFMRWVAEMGQTPTLMACEWSRHQDMCDFRVVCVRTKIMCTNNQTAYAINLG